MSSKVLLIGLDGATFSILDPLMATGVMPVLKDLLASGTRGELESVVPALTPPAWTSLMTGRTPGHHGIFDFLRFEFRPAGRQLRILDAQDVATPTIWSILARHGLRSSVLNFPMTFPVREFSGNVVPGWVPWRHLRLACYPRSLYDRITAAIPGFNPRELAMDMALEERALEGCHGEGDYENLIKLHIRREQQWFEVAAQLMREDPTDLTAVLFDGVDKLQHFCWRFLEDSIFPASPSPFESQVREWCLDYFRAIDSFVGRLIELHGRGNPVFVASDHGFGPTVEVFHVNAWLRENGYLSWADAANVEQKHEETLGMGTMAKRFYEIDWAETTAYCPTPSSNGIYITPPSADGTGVAPERYESFRRELADALLAYRDPATGHAPVARIWTREEVFSGPQMNTAPDLTLILRDAGFVSILPSDRLVKPRVETTGTHRPNGIFAAAGIGIRRGANVTDLSILDVAPALLHALGLPVPRELEGKVPVAVFEPEYLRTRPVTFEAPREEDTLVMAAHSGGSDPRMDAEIMGQLRALGYME
ncbi:MAG TPA: alkaline phosphatase family protein [Bryobacteraceae bacterium]|nr:alkaline phosphatase family protein [Bryobacteraceae bacterium]